jgi:hypothetical protein
MHPEKEERKENRFTVLMVLGPYTDICHGVARVKGRALRVRAKKPKLTKY